MESALCQQQCKSACAAAYVEDATGTELVDDDAGVLVEVDAVGVERVIDGGQSRVVKDCVGHAVTVPQCHESRPSSYPKLWA